MIPSILVSLLLYGSVISLLSYTMAPRSSSPSSSNPSYASDEQESTYLTRTRILHQIRLGIAILILAVATAVVGCEGAPLYHYNQTASFERLWLTLWPLNLDVRQTNAILACGSVIAFQALVYIIVALLPSVRYLSLLVRCKIKR